MNYNTMKKITNAFLLVLITNTLVAQNFTQKVVMSSELKYKIVSRDTSDMDQKRGEESNKMKTESVSEFSIYALPVENEKISVVSTLKKIKMNFDGWGQKIDYDSEQPPKTDNMFTEQIKKMVDKPDTNLIEMSGKKIEVEKEKKQGGKGGRGGGGMMRNMGGNSPIDNLFLLIPADVTVGKGWKVDNSKNDLKTQIIYFLESIDGNIASVSFKKKTKGTITRESQQGDMKIETDNLSEGTITVDTQTGIVKTYSEKTNAQSKVNMMGQDMPSKGVVISHFEVSEEK